MYKIDQSITLSRKKPKKNVYLLYFLDSAFVQRTERNQVYGIRYIEQHSNFTQYNGPSTYPANNSRPLCFGSPVPGMKNSTILKQISLTKQIIDEIRTIDPQCDIMLNPNHGLTVPITNYDNTKG